MSPRRQAPSASPSSNAPDAPDARVVAARKALLEGVGAEIAASFPGVTRLAGQVVAALYLADRPRSMDELSSELGRSKSNIFANLRGLEGAGIIERRREPGARHDSYALRGKYPDVIIGAYLARLRRVVHDKQALSQRALSLLGSADGDEADALRARLGDLMRKYNLFADLIHRYLPPTEGPVDLERLLASVPEPIFEAVKAAAQSATRAGAADSAPPPEKPRASPKKS
ncbi:MAG: MarR family transcriptional regulator [Polyangiaceae bacterium]|nr:MarR family transcriptional regulator [Polyangiaceae bacterium]